MMPNRYEEEIREILEEIEEHNATLAVLADEAKEASGTSAIEPGTLPPENEAGAAAFIAFVAQEVAEALSVLPNKYPVERVGKLLTSDPLFFQSPAPPVTGPQGGIREFIRGMFGSGGSLGTGRIGKQPFHSSKFLSDAQQFGRFGRFGNFLKSLSQVRGGAGAFVDLPGIDAHLEIFMADLIEKIELERGLVREAQTARDVIQDVSVDLGTIVVRSSSDTVPPMQEVRGGFSRESELGYLQEMFPDISVAEREAALGELKGGLATEAQLRALRSMYPEEAALFESDAGLSKQEASALFDEYEAEKTRQIEAARGEAEALASAVVELTRANEGLSGLPLAKELSEVATRQSQVENISTAVSELTTAVENQKTQRGEEKVERLDVGYLYIGTNVQSGRQYVGLSVNDPRVSGGRIEQHLSGRGSESIREDLDAGANPYDFNFQVLPFKDVSLRVLGELEKYFIQLLDTTAGGYNLSAGGEIPENFTTDDSRRIADALREVIESVGPVDRRESRVSSGSFDSIDLILRSLGETPEDVQAQLRENLEQIRESGVLRGEALEDLIAPLHLALAEVETELQRAETELSRSVRGDADIDTLQRETTEVERLLRRKTEVEREIFLFKEPNEDLRRAKELELETDYANKVEKLYTNVAKTRYESVRKFLDFEDAAREARVAAIEQEEKQIMRLYLEELEQQEKISEVAEESGRELTERLDIFREFDQSFGQQPDQVDQAFQAARDLAARRLELGEQPIDVGFDQFREAIDIDELIPSGDVESIFAVWDEYRRIAADAQRDVEDRIGQGSEALSERVAIEMREGAAEARDAMSEIAQETAKFFDDLNEDQLKRIRRDVRDVFRAMRSDARALSNDLVGLFDDVVISEKKTLEEGLQDFIVSSGKRLLQDFIETQIMIANQKRLQAELLKTVALRGGAAVGTNVLGALAGISTGGTAGLALGAVQALQVFLQIGDREIRDITDIQNRLGQQRRR